MQLGGWRVQAAMGVWRVEAAVGVWCVHAAVGVGCVHAARGTLRLTKRHVIVIRVVRRVSLINFCYYNFYYIL